MSEQTSESHIPVLLNEVLEFLKPKSDGIYIDGTIGLGGHSLSILQRSHPSGRLIGIDMDESALAIAEKRLIDFSKRISLIHGNFADLKSLINTRGYNTVDGVLLDLGVSSLQLDSPERGFSFQHPGPLDMRMDVRLESSASQVVNESTPTRLTEIFRDYGEEHFAKQIADRIIIARSEQPITTTLQLAKIVEKVYQIKSKDLFRSKNHRKNRKVLHPATRVFQALRIAVNDELHNLVLGLDAAVSVLRPGGILCAISFHSLEDRIVKQQFRMHSRVCICPPKTPICICKHEKKLEVLTGKPLLPSNGEIEANPRARSAKLRAALRI